MRCFSRRCSFADNRSGSRPLADVGVRMALAYLPALRPAHHHLLSCRIRSPHYYRKWYVPPRNRGRQSSPYSALAAATDAEVGRILRAMQAKQQIACRRNRTQHDGRHRNQRHTGYGSRTFIGFANPSKPMFHKAFHITHSFSDFRVRSDALRQCFHGMFHMSRLPVPETEDPHIAHTPASPHRANARHRR